MTSAKLLSKELSCSDCVPYGAHIARHIVKTLDGNYVMALRFAGIAFESADIEVRNAWHEQLNVFLRNIAAPELAVWVHVIRSRTPQHRTPTFDNAFAQQLGDRYYERLSGVRMYTNELYLTFVYGRAAPIKRLFGRLDRFDPQALMQEQSRAIEALESILSISKEGLARYAPVPLGTYESEGVLRSSLLEFLGHVLNGEHQPVPVTRTPINEVLPTSRPLFSGDTMELRTPVRTVLMGALCVKEYPASTSPGIMNGLLALPCEFVFTQSFAFLNRQLAIGIFRRQQGRMISAGDLAKSQIAELDTALDDLTAGRYAVGDHHISLFVKGSTQRELIDNIASARAMLSDSGMVVAREDIALEGAFWAQLPGNFAYRPRVAPLTSRNFASLSPFYNYAEGRRTGNHWGESVALLKTVAGAPYYFNFHQESLGNTIIIGPSGAGKTVLQGFMLAMLSRFGATGLYFDKDEGMHLTIRALGGRYLSLKKGERTGFNPFRMTFDETNVLFIQSLLKILVSGREERHFKAAEEKTLYDAVVGVFSLPAPLQKLASVLQFLDPTESDGMFARLQKWCGRGANHWVFDNDEDVLSFNAGVPNGFDTTVFLDDAELRTPILRYIAHRADASMLGKRHYEGYDEFWKMLEDDFLAQRVHAKNKTIRKMNGFVIAGTQSPADVLRSPFSASIIEQSATKIFLPNPFADERDYMEGFKCTRREFEIISTTPEKSRRFLVKQGHDAALCELDLNGMARELAVLSGTTANVALATEIMAQKGQDPALWLEAFWARIAPA